MPVTVHWTAYLENPRESVYLQITILSFPSNDPYLLSFSGLRVPARTFKTWTNSRDNDISFSYVTLRGILLMFPQGV